MDLRNRPPKHRRRANAGELRLSTAHPSASWSVVLPKNRRQLRAPIFLPLDESGGKEVSWKRHWEGY